MAVTVVPERDTTLDDLEPIVAVAHALLLRALEIAGKRVTGRDRTLRGQMQGVSAYRVHEHLGGLPMDTVTRALGGAWTLLPPLVDEHACCGWTAGDLETVLERYARDLLLSGRAADVGELRFRLGTVLGISVP